MSAVIAYVHGGTVRAEFMNSVLGVIREGSAPVEAVTGISSGPNISRARNLACAVFLEEHSSGWLWMCDTDMVFGPGTLDALIAAADPESAPIVGALCMTANSDRDPNPTLYELAERDGKPRWRIIGAWPEDTLMPVAATGAACLLIHRTALEKIAADCGDTAWPWFAESAIAAAPVGEDLTFCLRAREAGIPVHVHTGIPVGHIKPAILVPGQRPQSLGR